MTEIKKELQKIAKWQLSFIRIKWLRRLIDKLWYKIFKNKINRLIENELAKIEIKDYSELFLVKDIPSTEKLMFEIKRR